MRKNRKWLFIGGGVILLTLCLVGFLVVRNGMQNAQAQLAGTGEVVTAFVGDLSSGIVVALWIAARSGGRLPLWGGAGILVGLAMWWAVRRPYWKHGEPGARKWALGLMVFGVIGVAAVVVGVELVRAVVDTLRGTGPG